MRSGRYKSKYFAVPPSFDTMYALGDGVSPDKLPASNQIHIEVDMMAPPSIYVWEAVTEYHRDHGEAPKAVLVGWQTYLALCVEYEQYQGMYEWREVKLHVTRDWPIGATAIPKNKVWDLLQVLANEGRL